MIIVRTLMGLLFIFASVVVLFNLVQPPPLSDGSVMKKFNEGLMSVGYFFPLLKITELLCGIAFVVGRFVPLATIVISPIIINIAAYHFIVDRTMPGPAIAAFLVLANAFVAYYYRACYAGVLAAK